MNNINLIGRVATELELKISKEKETIYLRFNLAVKRKNKKDITDFIPCVAFGKLAQTLKTYIRKGHKIGIEGELLTSRYKINGEERTAFDVNIDTVDFLEPKKKAEGMTEEEKEKVKGTLLEPKHNLIDDYPFD